MDAKLSCDATINHYLNHLKSNFEILPVDNGCLIVTPYVYPDLASIEIFIEPNGNEYLLTDDGETFNMLFTNGLESNKNLVQLVESIARRHGILYKDDTLFARTSYDNLSETLHTLLNAIQAIGYLLHRRSDFSMY